MHELMHILGLRDSTSAFYLFWSGIGANTIAIIGGVYGFIKLKKQRNHHHEQLKRHIDYRFSKLTDESNE